MILYAHIHRDPDGGGGGDGIRVGTNTRHMVDMGQGLTIRPLRYTYWASCFKPESFTSTIRY